MLYYIYNNDELVGFKYNGNTYHYHKNLFGDVIGIYDSNNDEIVTYEYDSWGTIVNTIDNSNINLSTINPFRYRSYYYDEETKLYYLNSRYYNPLVGRFINADAYVSTGQGTIGHNMYNYCGNNPINRCDDGHKWFEKIKKKIKEISNSIISEPKRIQKEIKESDNLIDYLKDKFVFEWGTGLGVKTKLNSVFNTGFATTFGETYNNGEWYAYDRFGADATLGLNENLEVGFSYEATHYGHGPGNDYVAFNIPEIISCEHTEVDTTLFLQNQKTNAKIDGTFVGLSIDLYLIVGVSVKIGFVV